MKNKLKVYRAINNLTQADLAEKIGVSRQSINAIETNKYVPSTVLALKLSRLFKTPVEDLFQLDGEYKGLVHIPPVVVGASDSGLVLPRL